MSRKPRFENSYGDLILFGNGADSFHFPEGKELVIFEAFAGIGMQSEGLKIWKIPHSVMGVSEVDSAALISYAKMHTGIVDEVVKNIDVSKEEMLEELVSAGVGFNFSTGKQTLTERTSINRLKRIYASHKYCKNLGDISKVHGKDLPVDLDIMTYSFPCQDLSNIGERRGMLEGETRSGLVFEILRIAKERKELGREIPVLIMENVEGIYSAKFKSSFAQIKEEWSELGYSNYDTLALASDYGVPQRRPRAYMVSIMGDYNFHFPQTVPLKIRIQDLLDLEKIDGDYKYMSEKAFKTFSTFQSFNGFLRMVIFRPLNPFNDEEVMPTFTTRMNNAATDGFILEPVNGWDLTDDKLMNIDYRNATRDAWMRVGVSIMDIRRRDAAKVKRGVNGKWITEYDNWEELEAKAFEAINVRDVDGRVVIELDGYDFYIRYLTGREAFRFMSISDASYEKLTDVSDSAKFKQAGNGLVGVYFAAIVNELLHPNDRKTSLEEDSSFWVKRVKGLE